MTGAWAVYLYVQDGKLIGARILHLEDCFKSTGKLLISMFLAGEQKCTSSLKFDADVARAVLSQLIGITIGRINWWINDMLLLLLKS